MMRNIAILFFLVSVPAVAADPADRPAAAQVREQSVTVGGQVRRPGYVPMKIQLNLFEAVQAAGGPTEFGAMRRVKLIREGRTSIHDLREDKQKLIRVSPGDIIEVPQKNFFGR